MPTNKGISPTRVRYDDFPRQVAPSEQGSSLIAGAMSRRAHLETIYETVPGSKAQPVRALHRDSNFEYYNLQCNLSFLLFKSNPFANKLVDTFVEFIVGDGIRPLSKDKDTQAILDAFWDDEYNDWPNSIERRVRDLMLYGEWLHQMYIKPDGMVWVNSYQPTIITQMFVLDTNHEKVAKIMARKANDGVLSEEEELPVVIPLFGDEGNGDFTGYAGDFFSFGLKKTTDSARGMGLLFPLVDHLDVFEGMLFSRAEKVGQGSALWWNLSLDGHNQAQIDKFLRDHQVPPKSGGVWAHNQASSLTLESPSTAADDHAQDVSTERSHILGASGLPDVWFGGANSSRAATVEANEPTYKAMVAMQERVKGFIRKEIDFMLWNWEQKNPEFKRESYSIKFTRPAIRDIQRTGAAIHRMSEGLATSIAENIITREQATQIMVSMLNEVGITHDQLIPELNIENFPGMDRTGREIKGVDNMDTMDRNDAGDP